MINEDCNVNGLEDIRLFVHDNELWYSATTKEYSSTDKFQIVIGKVVDNKLCDNLVLNFDIKNNQKNWCFFSHNSKLYCVYSWEPFMVFEVNTINGKLKMVVKLNYEENLVSLRGSTNGMIINSDIYFMVHSVHKHKNNRTYFHRIVRMDLSTLNIIDVSEPFYFNDKGIEYCCGLTWKEDKVYFSWSSNDSSSNVSFCSKNDFINLFEDYLVNNTAEIYQIKNI